MLKGYTADGGFMAAACQSLYIDFRSVRDHFAVAGGEQEDREGRPRHPTLFSAAEHVVYSNLIKATYEKRPLRQRSGLGNDG